MILTKFEQSGFIIETNSGFRLAVDIGAFTPIEKLADISVDAVLVSHLHGDHFSIEHIKALLPKKVYLSRECIDLIQEETISAEIVEIKSGNNIAIDDIVVTLFDVDHGPNVTLRPRENFGFLIETNGEKVYFAGDMFYQSGIDVTNLDVDYVLIPVGTFYTFGPDEAFEFIKQFKKIGKVISMHYEKTPETRDRFIELAQNNFEVK